MWCVLNIFIIKYPCNCGFANVVVHWYSTRLLGQRFWVRLSLIATDALQEVNLRVEGD